ncbi:hypothetical protein QN344_02535, partial [Mucilaginibacter sp. 5B2]|nr:hypothetical protein [Mucilaginibacter sp. 5B2]
GNTLMIKLTGEVNADKIFASNAANDADKPVVKYTTANGSAYLTNNGDISNIVKVAVSIAKSNNTQGTFNGTLTGSLDSQNPVFGDRAITNGKFNITLDS